MILLDTFIGRFHPLIVHLPIGFILLGILTEWFYRNENVKSFVAFAWLLGGVSAFVAALLGWLLANEGGYEASSLFWHRWLGIALTIFSFGIYVVKSGRWNMGKLGNQFLNLSAIALLTFVGHLGGNMTHGSNYLVENAPPFVKAVLGEEAREERRVIIDKSVDSTYLYADLIEPVFEVKCMRCHNDEVQRGALNMASPEKMMEGGDHGAVFAAGSATESELFRRVTLLPDHAKYMPLKGEPMTFQEIKMLEWWLEEGASFETRLAAMNIPKNIAAILLAEYGLDVSNKPHYEKVKVAAASEQAIKKLIAAGFKVKTLATENNLLDVSYTGKPLDNLDLLLAANAQITWLNLDNAQINDAQLKTIGQLTNLTRLRIQNNAISDKGVAHLVNLKYLESLNLHHTQVTDQAAESIKKMAGLKRVYLWETPTTVAILESLQAVNPNLEIDLGVQFTALEIAE